MGAAIGEWEMVTSGLFLLVLQLVGINLAGALVFRLYGLGPSGPRYARGRPPVAWAAAATLFALGALVGWQWLSPSPTLQRATIQQRARDAVRQALREVPDVQVAEVNARFTRPDIPGQRTLVVTILAQRASGAAGESDQELRRRVAQQAQRSIEQQGFGVTPLVDVTIASPPGGSP
jgi:uncharacterized membrane protein